MGLFSNKKKTIVGAQVQRLIKDEMLPDSIRTGVTKSIFQNGDVPDYVMEELIGSIGLKADRMYEYGKNHYVHGLPSGQFLSANAGRAAAQAVIEGQEGAPVLMQYCNLGPPNYLHLGWMRLISDHGYDTTTNKLANLSAIKGHDVFLYDMVVVVPAASIPTFEPGALDQWGSPPTTGPTPSRKLTNRLRAASPVIADPAAAGDMVRVTYEWATIDSELVDGAPMDVTNIHQESFTIELGTLVDLQADYFHVKYVINDVVKYVLYKIGTGTFPTLDAFLDIQPEVNGTFFPFAYFRFNKSSENSNKNTNEYKTAKKLVKYLGMDYDMVADSINENPDIGDVEQAMLMMGVPASTEDPMERRYLYAFFDNLFAGQAETFRSAQAGQAAVEQSGQVNRTENTIVIQDARFKMALSNTGIFKRRLGGVIGPKGSYTSGIRTETHEQQYYDPTTETGAIYTTPVKTHYYRFQVSDHLYDEVEVTGLKMLYYVLGGYTTTADEEDDILLIPIDKSLLSGYSIPDRETLYARSLHMVFTTVQIITVKWYQTGVFQFIMLIVSAIITIFTGPGGAGLLAGVLAGTVAASTIILQLIVTMLINLAIGFVLQLFVKLVGPEIGMIIAIFAALAGSVELLSGQGIPGLPLATDLLKMANGLSKAVIQATQEELGDLLEEYKSWEIFKDAEQKKLDAAQRELFGSNSHLSPFVIFGESPNDYYNRTAHSGNIGLIGISAISSYVDTALTLPKLDETMRGNT